MATNTRVPSTSAPGDGSRTITLTSSTPRPERADTPEGVIGTLRLQGGPRNQQRVAWGDDVVDNEGCGRKSSKICCIYHKPRKFDESSSEEDSDSDTDSDSLCDHNHNHNHPRRNSHNGAGPQLRPDQPAAGIHVQEKGVDRNAYEIMPSVKKGKRKAAS